MAWSLVQKKHINWQYVSGAQTATMSASFGTGNAVVVFIADIANASPGSFTITDNGGNAYTKLITYVWGGLFLAYNVASANAVTVNPNSGSNTFLAQIVEFAGALKTSSPYDACNQYTTYPGGQYPTSTNAVVGATTHGDNELVFGVVLGMGPGAPNPDDSTWTLDSGYTKVLDDGITSVIVVSDWGVQATANSSFALHFTASPDFSVYWNNFSVTLKPLPPLMTGTGAPHATAASSGSGSESFSGTAAPHAIAAHAASATQTVTGSGGVQTSAAISGTIFEADNVGNAASVIAAQTLAAGSLSFSGAAALQAPCALAAAGTELFTSPGAALATTAQAAAGGAETFSGVGHTTALAALAAHGVMMPPLALWPRANW